jgi:Fe2+ or Zn2+ uptake regulation protein
MCTSCTPLSVIHERLRTCGCRRSKLRDDILEILSASHATHSAPELITHLHEHGVQVNKTSVYRELDLLMIHQAIERVTDENESAFRYVFSHGSDHHHHLTCTHCNHIEIVTDTRLEEILTKTQELLAQNAAFTQIQHTLGFHGLCRNCTKQVA